MTQTVEYVWTEADQARNIRVAKADLAEILQANKFGLVPCSGKVELGRDTDINTLREELIARCDAGQGWEANMAVSLQALMTVVERHKLKPVNGEYQLTDEMMAEAAAIDEASGTGMTPEKLADLLAAINGKPQPNDGGWELVFGEERIGSQAMDVDVEKVEAFTRRINAFLKEERPHYLVAIGAMATVMTDIARLGLGLEDEQARSMLAGLFYKHSPPRAVT
jgi:hypothetical protein